MKNRLLYIIYTLIFLLLISLLYVFFLQKKEHNFIFSYPKLSDINFAGETVPFDGKHFYNKERFDKEYLITSNTLYQLFLYVKRYPSYIPYIEKKLKEKKIPDDFKYLAIAESALRNEATSHAGAAGLWQFMPDTAKEYLLIVNEYVDERNNFEKSTEAALTHILELHEIFNNWTLTAAAYNRGENGLQRDMKSQGVESYYDLYLNEETSRYVFRILAIKYILKEYFSKKTFVDFFIGDPYEVPKTETLQVSKIENLFIWCQENKQNYNSIKVLNPWILRDALPEGDWDIKILKD